MKTKIMKCLALVLAMTCILCFPTPASAAAQGTDGTELEVVQPEQLEIQLGESWAGVAFELKTDAGMYPGVILVGEDGILRLEIGGSTSYILTCMNSEVEIPEPDAAQRTEGVSEAEDTVDTLPTEDTEAAAYPEERQAHSVRAFRLPAVWHLRLSLITRAIAHIQFSVTVKLKKVRFGRLQCLPLTTSLTISL